MSTANTDNSKLTQPAQFLKGVGPARAQMLQKMGLRTAADVLFCFPRRYEDFTQQTTINQLQVDQLGSVIGTVTDVDERRKSDGKGHVLYVLIQQGDDYLRGIWFNQQYMLSKFQIGQTVQFSGKVALRGLRYQMTHPKVVWIDNSVEPPEPQLVPVYPLTEGINQNQMRKIVAGVVDEFASLVEESFPAELQFNAGVCGIRQSIEQIHSPLNQQQLDQARRRLVYQELLVLQLALAIRRHRVRNRGVAAPLRLTPKINARMMGRLPFELTPSQSNAFQEIAADMAAAVPMNRLLHGDVGSGKTVVALCAIMLAIANGHQAVLMAPTEILAQQHFRTISGMLAGGRVRVALLTGGLSPAERRQTHAAIESGDVDLVIGTTAVAAAGLIFNQLGLVVIDEQHKFGVRQRALLKQSGFDPHYLVMTATPIPRTVTMTLFGDLDVSTLSDRRSGTARVHTYLGVEANREQWWEFFCKKLREGRQGLVIAPHIDGDDDSNINSAERLYESLANGPLESFQLAVLHGRLPTDEKDAVMQAFADNQVQVLVATGVVEVGIDVPNATVMTIESAERFGLSQLHQLRGRVGRGQHPGYVCCYASTDNPHEIERLKAFETTDDGFALSQLDLQLRGPGNILGTRQTGFPPLKIADLIRDEALLMETQKKAREIIDRDPDLADPEYRRLRQLVLLRYGRSLDLSDVG